MVALIGSVVAIVAACVAVGAFLDRYAKPAVRNQAWAQISSATRQKLSARAVNFVVLAYESIFTGKIGSKKFFRRSLLAYFGIFAASLVFLAFVFPSVFVMILSPYMVGSWWEATAVALLTIAGSIPFWAANAQTLYFLRLAQSDPRPTPIAVIFYADALLTTSIAILGIGTLFWLLSIAHLASGAKEVSVQVRVVPAAVALKSRLESVRSDGASLQATIIAGELARSRKGLEKVSSIVARNAPSPSAVSFARRDFDFVLDLYPQNGMAVRQIDDDSLQFLGSQGEVTSFKSISFDLRTDWGRLFEDKLSASEVCKQILDPALVKEKHYVIVEHVSFSKGYDELSCRNGSIGTISAKIDIDNSNVDYGQLYVINTNLVFQHLVYSVTTGFSTFAAVQPLWYFNPDDEGSAWEHKHVMSEDKQAGRIALDRDFLKSYLVENGVSASILNKTLPGGIILTAIMLTSSFTVILLISALAAGLLASAARSVTVLGSMFEVKDHPFVFVMLVGGILLSLSYAVFLRT